MLDEAFSDLAAPEGCQGQASMLAEHLMELYLSSCPNSRTGESDVEDRASQRYFSPLLSERMSTGGSLLVQVQKHWQTAMVGSSTAVVEAAKGPHIEEQGKVFQQNVIVIKDTLKGRAPPPSADMVSRVAPMSSVQRL